MAESLSIKFFRSTHLCLNIFNELSRHELRKDPLYSQRGVTYLLLKRSIVIANTVDSDQTPRSVASDLGLHCLQMSLLWDARLKRIKIKMTG